MTQIKESPLGFLISPPREREGGGGGPGGSKYT